MIKYFLCLCILLATILGINIHISARGGHHRGGRGGHGHRRHYVHYYGGPYYWNHWNPYFPSYYPYGPIVYTDPGIALGAGIGSLFGAAIGSRF